MKRQRERERERETGRKIKREEKETKFHIQGFPFLNLKGKSEGKWYKKCLDPDML